MDWGDSIPGTADTPAGIPAAVEQFDYLTIGDAVTVGSLIARTGRLEFGSRPGARGAGAAGDAVVGFVFEGNGEMN